MNCPNCGKEVSEDTKFCPHCGKRLIETQGEQTAISAWRKELGGGTQGKRMSWFERHLNWTMVLAWVGAGVIAFIVGFLAGLADPYVSEDALGGIGFIIELIVSILVGRWVLRKKNRSMWWLLISGSPLFLLLSNKGLTQVQDEGAFKSDSESKKEKMSKKKLVGIAVACIIGILVVLAIAIPSEPTSTPYIYENGAIIVGGDGEPIELINNPDATNPTYAELVAFIVTDSTDTKDYLKLGLTGYVCADFAEDVHNNAEAAGIRAAWVSIDFGGNDEGHACNAFETTDRGLVYIDCTGETF